MTERPPLIAISGVDGSGKSTQIDLLRERMSAEGIPSTSTWVGGTPYLTRPAVLLAKRFLGSPSKHPSTATPDGQRSEIATTHARYVEKANRLFERSALLRWGWIQASLFEHALEARLKIRSARQPGHVLICDRYLLTSIVDAAILTNISEQQTLELLGHPAFRLAPRLDSYILIDVPAEVALTRIHDAPSETFIKRRVPLYRALAESAGMPIIDGTLPVEEVSDRLWEVVRASLTGAARR